MKRKIISGVLILFATVTTVKAQNSDNSSQQKSKRRYGNLAVNLDSFKGFTIPPIMLTAELVYNDTLSWEVGVIGSYASTEDNIMGYSVSSSVLSYGPYIGGNYYLNNLLKLDMDKFTLSGGAGVSYAMAMTTTEIQGNKQTTNGGSFGIGANVKGRYFFTPKVALLARVDFAKGGTAIYAGLSFLTSRK